MAESRALIKALHPGDQRATLIVNGNEGINAVCITIDPHNTEKVLFFPSLAFWAWWKMAGSKVLCFSELCIMGKNQPSLISFTL